MNFAKCLQDISRGGNFHDTTPISFIKAYGFYFRVGGGGFGENVGKTFHVEVIFTILLRFPS